MGCVREVQCKVQNVLFIGLPVSAVLYLFFCRSLDLATEFRMSDAEGKMPVAHAISQSEISTDD